MNTQIIGIIAIALALVLGIVGVASKKKPARMGFGIIGVVFLSMGLLVLVLPLAGVDLSAVFGTLAVGDVPEQEETPAGEELPLCAIEDTTVTLASINAYTSTATGGTHAYRVNTDPIKTVSDAGSFTASPGNKIQVLWFNESGTTYFSDLGTYEVPCQGTKTFSTNLYANSSATFTVFNSNGDVMGASNTESLVAGDVMTLDAELKGEYQKGSPFGEVVVCYYNKTALDDCIVDISGSGTNEVNVPPVVSIAAGFTAKAYLLPALLSTEKLKGTITLDADDTNNPAVIDSNATLYLYANNYLINEKTGKSFDGPAIVDEDDAVTSTMYGAYTLGVA